MKTPCQDCITLAICRSKLRAFGELRVCPLLCKYVDPPDGIYVEGKERYMYRQTRINKVRKALGLKKARNSGVNHV